VKTPDIVDSRVKKLRIEIPHFTFSHSSSDGLHYFVGRERGIRKLKELVEDTDDKTGIYLVTGSRGVGKTSMINQVIKKTSLTSGFFDHLKYLFVMACAVAVTNLFLQCTDKCNAVLHAAVIFGVISFFLLCCFNNYWRKVHGFWKKITNFLNIALKELFSLKSQYNPYRTLRYFLKICLVVSYTVIIVSYKGISPAKAFFIYLCLAVASTFWWFINDKLHEYYQKYKKDRIQEKGIYKNEKKIYMVLLKILFHVSVLLLAVSPVFNINKALIKALMIIPFIIASAFVVIYCCNFFKRSFIFNSIVKIIFYEAVLAPILYCLKTCNRVYLRLNFGHKLKDEKDILRLITRTLNTEYKKYHREYWRRLYWIVIAFVFLFTFAIFLGNAVSEQKIYEETASWIRNHGTSLSNAVPSEEIKSEKIFSIKTAVNLLFAIDQIVSKTVNQVKWLFGSLWDKGILLSKDNCINYSFLLSFFFLYLCFILLFRSNWLMSFFVTHRMIMRQLKKLNSDITYSTERENSIKITGDQPQNIFPGIGTSIKKSREVADARELEKRLQDIFENIKRIPFFMGRPKFVIVFDELDKVEPGESDAENKNQETKAMLFSIDAARERQTEILKIMSNMKYFLSTAEAKFIFIAGREMYDIYLADVSERNNYIGSIFSSVIEVSSFLTDHAENKSQADMTTLTEEFVCQRLFPYDYPVGSYDLKNYRDYLERIIYKKQSIEEKYKIQKIIAVLQQFIIYLAHLSKGAPKKMMQLFESFIEVCKADEIKDDDDQCQTVRYYRRSGFFLSFDFYQQYAIGLIAYLITPIFNRIVEVNISESNDKLLVSSLRFVDFVFKFHRHSFSWKHLDISPEMLEINHAPELKPITEDLLNFMAQIHIIKSNFSLFDYKFDNLIANEIFAMTKTDEVSSALFSFSLDETLPLKKFYRDLLANTQKEYKDEKKSVPTEFIDAISSLQIVLGDLHYYDDELEEAGTYYRNAVDTLRVLGKKRDDDKDRGNSETMNPEHLYLYIRNMLKVGMIYEKRKQHEFAYLIYGEICERIIRERNITFEELGAGIVLRKEGNKYIFIKASTIERAKDIRKTEKIYRKEDEEKKYNDNIEIQQKGPNEIEVKDNIARPQPLYFETISPDNNVILFRKMTYEGLKLLYMPFIAKLQILEKSHMGGIARTHLEQLDKEFELLTFIVDHEEANILEADFYSRVADVLYYKNADLKEKSDKKRTDEDIDKYVENQEKKSDEIDTEECPKSGHCSCTVCHYYYKALYKLLNKDYNDKGKENKKTVPEMLSESIKIFDNRNYSNIKFCTVLARILSDWGNVFFSCDKGKDDDDKCYICDIKKYNEDKLEFDFEKSIKYTDSEMSDDDRRDFLNSFTPESVLSKPEIAFAMYAISFQAFRKANNYKRAAYQIYKMLRLFKYYKIYNNEYIKRLSKKAIRFLWHAADVLNVYELNERKKDLNKRKIEEEISLQYLLVDSEITRILILAKDLEFRSDNKHGKLVSKLKKYYNMHIASPYGINYSIPAMIYQLKLKSIVNYEAYEGLKSGNAEIIFGEYFNNIGNDENIIKAYLIAESIYCLKEILRLSKTIGETYLFTHSFKGSIHNRLSDWIIKYEKYEKEQSNKNVKILYNQLKHFFGYGWKEQLSGHYENKQALLYYQKSIEMHGEGKAYHTMLDSMYFVKDDFNDRQDHFNIAEERHLIVNGKIGKKIKDIKDMYNNSKLYDVDRYFNKVDES